MKIEVSASVLSCDFGYLADAVKLCEASGVDRIHVDAMDGHFVPNITIGPIIAQAVRKYTSLPVKAHLMIEHPWDYLDAFMDAGVDILGLQVECYGERRAACRAYNQYPKEIDVLDIKKLMADMLKIKNRGKEACLVINPGTPVNVLDSVLSAAGSVLVMSVDPSFRSKVYAVFFR